LAAALLAYRQGKICSILAWTFLGMMPLIRKRVASVLVTPTDTAA
jgi:hypothetical protein